MAEGERPDKSKARARRKARKADKAAPSAQDVKSGEAKSTASASAVSTPSMPRWSLGLLDLLHALVMGAAASVLPWREFTVFAVLAGLAAITHALRAALVLTGHPSARLLFRYGAVVSLVLLLYMTWGLGSSAVYVARLYGSLGQGIAAAAGAILAVGVLFTLPIAAWGIGATGGLRLRGAVDRGGAALLALLVAGAVVDLVRQDRTAAGDSVDVVMASAGEDGEAIRPELTKLKAVLKSIPGDEKNPAPQVSLFKSAPITCPGSVGADVVTLFVAYVYDARSGEGSPATPRPTAICLQGDSVASVFDQAVAALKDGYIGGPIKVDLVHAVQELPNLGPLLGMLSVRPGLDGACLDATCLAPWQLVAQDLFTRMGKVSEIQLRFGVTADSLRRALGDAEATPDDASFEGIVRIATQSWLLRPRDGDDDQIVKLVRLRDGGPELDASSLKRATDNALAFILDVQQKDGRFAYIVDPFRGSISFENFSVPRQAGTTLALCELAPEGDTAARQAAWRSLNMLAGLEQEPAASPDDPERRRGALIYPKGAVKWARLGDTALPLIAFLACRERVGTRFDANISRMGHLLLSMQRPDGGFHPNLDTRTGKPVVGPDPLYAEGQVVMALVLWEQQKDIKPAPPQELGAAIDRAMDHFAGPYWDYAMRDFFFLEENWHCLAARAALSHHRHDAYERFCIDYVTMKERLTFDEGSDVAPELIGAYGFGNVLPPHNTATAGFGEALAAKMALMKARGMDTTADEEVMKRTLRFLVAQQWQEDNCFACSKNRRIVGAFSEHVGSPQIRIDFVQHALAAMGHGGRVLGWVESPAAKG